MRRRWIRAALCRRFSHLPWLNDTSDVTEAQAAAMRTVCEACPVARECADFVRVEQIDTGFWAGVARTPSTPTERGGAA
jgi:hypothetical protein